MTVTGQEEDEVRRALDLLTHSLRQAAQQPVVGGGDARHVVEGDRGEAGNVDLEFPGFGNAGRQGRVQSVDAFDDQYRPLVELQGVVVPLAGAGDEVVTRNIDALAPFEAFQMVVELFEVDRFECLVVVLSVFVAWRLFAVHEIVVQRDQYRVESQDPELYAQPFGEGGLAAGRRA